MCLAVDAGVSGSKPPEERPGAAGALSGLALGTFGALIVARVDRIGRRALDVLRLADQAKQEGWDLISVDIGLDTSSPAGLLTLTVIAAAAELERSLISARTKEALASAKKRGVRLGRPVRMDRDLRRHIVSLRKVEGHTLQEIADILTEEGVPTVNGGRWWPSNVAAAIKSAEIDAEIADKRVQEMEEKTGAPWRAIHSAGAAGS